MKKDKLYCSAISGFRFGLLALVVCMIMSAPRAFAQRVMVLDIDEEIDATAWRHTRSAIDETLAATPPYSMFIVKLNTYGGAVDMADSIRTALLKMPIPTVAFVDHNAASAGALIVLACDSAYMAPGSSLGAATVVNGQGEPMPQKFQSYWTTVMRSTAASHGKYIAEGDSVERWRRDPDIAADMVNPDKAVSFTTEEAVAAGLVDGTATSVDDLLDKLGMPQAQVEVYHPSFTDVLMGFFASSAVRAILIMLILGGLYMEMHTAGLGFAGAVATVSTVLYFMPMFVGGTLAPWVVIVFILGVVLLALEIFVIPGFGIAGISGILAIMAALLGAMIHPDSITGFSMADIWQPVGVLLAGICLAVGAVLLLTSKYGPKKFRNAAALTTELSSHHGFVGVDMAPETIVGKKGIAATELRPAGKVEIDGEVYDAVSVGMFIKRNSAVKVVRYEAAQIYVEPENEKF